MKTFRIILTVLLAVLILGLGAVLYSAFRVAAMDSIYPNLVISGIEVGGLTREQAAQRLSDQGWEDYLSKPLSVATLAGQSFLVDPARSGVLSSAEEMAQLAWNYGRDGNLIENLISYLDCRSGQVRLEAGEKNADREYLLACIAENEQAIREALGEKEYIPEYENSLLVLKKGWGQLQIDTEGLCNAIIQALQNGETELRWSGIIGELQCPDFRAIYAELQKEPKDAEYTEDGRFEVIDEVVGCSFDITLAEELWNNAGPGETVEIPMEVTWQAVTGQQLRSRLFRDLLGACTTHYYNSSENRRSNVRLASSKVNGYILYPGDIFSYNTVVGARTEEAGFLPAPAYVDGDVQDEIGGGACQVSSTLYAATLFAFLETVDRTCHMFPVHYMQLGTDATVTIPDGGQEIDFKFRNNKTHPIKIVAYCEEEDSALTFEIWGTLEEDDFMPIEFDNTWGWEYTYDRFIEKADPNRPGYKIKLEHEKYYFEEGDRTGYRTLTWRRVYDEYGGLVFEEYTNMLLPNGLHGMDTYYDHNE